MGNGETSSLILPLGAATDAENWTYGQGTARIFRNGSTETDSARSK